MTALREFFGPGVMARGVGYFRDDAVRVTSHSDEQVAAEIRGTHLYRAGIRLRDGVASFWCSCPYVERNDSPCKHLWALVQVADVQGYLALLETEKVRQARVATSLEAIVESERDDGDEEFWEERDPDEDAGLWDGLDPDEEDFEDELPDASYGLPQVVDSVSGLIQARLQAALAGRSASEVAPLLAKIMPALPHELRRSYAAELLGHFESSRAPPTEPAAAPIRRPAELLCVLEPLEVRESDRLSLKLWIKGQGSVPQPLTGRLLREVELDGIDGIIVNKLRKWQYYASGTVPVALEDGLSLQFIRQLCREQRIVYWPGDAALLASAKPLRFDYGGAWRLQLHGTARNGGLLIAGKLARKAPRKHEVRALEEAAFLTSSGLVGWEDRVARLKVDRAWHWVAMFEQRSPFAVPAEEVEDFLDVHYAPEGGPELVLADDLRLEPAEVEPQPRLTVTLEERTGQLHALVEFEYGERRIRPPHRADHVVDLARRKSYPYNAEFERAALSLLSELGFRGSLLKSVFSVYPDPYLQSEPLRIGAKRLPNAIDTLLLQGWRVQAHGKIYRRRGQFKLSVASGQDWLELQGGVDFDGQRLGLPELLRAVRRGINTVELGDGTVGVLPEEWLAGLGMLAGAKDAPAESESVRVPRAQLMLVDELARHEASIQVDEAYRRLRAELENFSELTPADAPHGFRGTLRDYQREGLAWLKLLGRLGFGACLADDMGLGKTVQVLALLLGRNRRRRRLPPSLVVAPSSVVFNWIDEARRFTPSLRVVAYAGAERPTLEAALDKADLIVTSYTMLRNEASSFGAVVFDYVVLDEAQAIKNYDTATAKAARALSASCRLTMTGTPIENHLGELGSQLEFLNPGMLSSSPRLYKALTAGRVGDESLEIVQRAVRPFLLRRTKGEVARELPDRIEKTLYVELEGAERRRYDELLTHYRERIKQKVAKLGLARSTPQVLEALLRLRQAACHPGLLDAGRAAESSAKLDRLLFELDRVLAAGGKCLVFSQFTSLLAIVKKCLDARGIAYEYLDGATRDRKNPVQRFQNSTDVGIFLISLKAGGVGLNLTAAEHVFLLDPWWNPAVEAQAIDRTHRIGQSRHILAYKLIARRTVEEKVVELQREKRALAQAILGEDAGLGAKLTREDLEALLD